MAPILMAIGGIGAIGLVLWMAWTAGKSAGRADQDRVDTRASNEALVRELKASADAPKTLQDVANAARRGEF